MSRSLRRGAVAAVIIATAPILAACSAGGDAATLQVRPDNAATSISTLKLNGIVVVTDKTGQPPASVTTNIANTGTGSGSDDTLVSVAVDGTPAQLSGPAPLKAGSSLLLGGPDQVSALVPLLKEAPGQNAQVTFTFAKAGQVTVQALVTAGTGQYGAYAPVAPTTAAASPSVSASPSASSTAAKAGKSTAPATAKATASASPTH